MRYFIFSFLLSILGSALVNAQSPNPETDEYFPLPDSLGGWRTLTDAGDIRRLTGMDKKKLDEAFDFVRTTTINGGLLVVRHGYLVYERYFGKGQRDATPNLGSCAKSFTSIAVGILMQERPDLFPDGLDQKIFTPKYLPPEAFPLSDPRMADIKLGQLLSFTSGIRGNNPVYVNGKPSTIDPAGPDGWYAMVDENALGHHEGEGEGRPFSTRTLWCEPGWGYSYATAAIHIASMMVRHISGMELQDYLQQHLAQPLGWGRWGYGYKYAPLVAHTPGGGGIALRSTDMLRFCYLLLHDGRWNDRQVVPAEYVEKASHLSPYNPHFPYSLQFTVNGDGHMENVPRDAYWKAGSGGHCLYVVPSLDLVVWKLGGRNGQYGIRDTGIPEPEPVHDPIPPIGEGIAHPSQDVYLRPLEMVIAAIGKEQHKEALPGQIMPDPSHPGKLVRNRDGNGDGQPDPFFLCGPGGPEGFLYRGKRNPDGTRAGDQVKLIEKLKKEGGNSIYFIAVRTHGGDAWKDKRDDPATYPDDLHNPWIDQDPHRGLNGKILDQWESWFTKMDDSGIVIYFFIYDDAIKVAKQLGWPLDANGNLQAEEKKFIQALVKRFSHHKNLIWCTMEEGQEIGSQWHAHIAKIAEAIREADPYPHVIASHQLSGNIFFHKDEAALTQFAIQTDKDEVRTIDQLHQWMLGASDDAQGRYSLVMAEDWVQGNLSAPNGDRKEIRQRNWAAAMAGAYAMVFGIEIHDTPDEWLHDCQTLSEFFQSTTFNQMSPNDALALADTKYVLANDGYDYILYSRDLSKKMGMKNLPEGTYSFTWLDCVDGRRKDAGKEKLASGDHSWRTPRGFDGEVALYIRREDKRPAAGEKTVARSIDSGNGPSANTAPVVADEAISISANTGKEIQLKFKDADGGPGPYTIKLVTEPKHGKLSGVGNDKTFTPEKGFTGEDQFSWKVNDGKADSEVATVRLIIR